jgi:hypothetical protein
MRVQVLRGNSPKGYDAFGNLAAEYANGTSWSQDYIRWGRGATDRHRERVGACTTCYFSYDHLASVRLVTDANATVIGRHDYLPCRQQHETRYELDSFLKGHDV